MFKNNYNYGILESTEFVLLELYADWYNFRFQNATKELHIIFRTD